jgi:hypothetical protein
MNVVEYHPNTQIRWIIFLSLFLSYLSTGDCLKAPELLSEIGQPDRVMEDPVRSVVVGVGPTNYTNHWQVVTVSASNSVDNAEPADRECDHASAHALGARIPVSSVPSVELVAAADQVQLLLGNQVVQKRKVEVAGHGEHIPHADLHEPSGQVAPQRADQGDGLDWRGSRAWMSP